MAAEIDLGAVKVLRGLMRKHKLNCRAVGALIDRSHSTVLHWHAGVRPIPRDKLEHLKLKLQTGILQTAADA
jgi:hypothetical protein